jgi:Mannosyl-glycoprotein endo-beta-N-acetylglucosaminidase
MYMALLLPLRLMKNLNKSKIFLVLIIIFIAKISNAQDENLSISAIEKYIEKYKTIAINEQIRVGIPASITLAQGIHESAANTSELATKANNHFGIKCKKGWEGETFLHDDDALQECFRKYESDLDSYLDHSNYLKNNRRYSFLFDIPLDNYKEWAVGLRKAGYATNPKYSARLTELIEKYKLAQYTELAIKQQQKAVLIKENEEINFDKKAIEEEKIAKTEKKIKAKKNESERSSELVQEENNLVNGFAKKLKNSITSSSNTELLNGLQGFYAKKGQLLLQEAVSRNIKYSKLLELNDLNESPLESDMFIYLEKKFKKSPLKKNHIVLGNESLHNIAQAEGMQLKALRSLNLLEVDEEPAEGVRIYLQEEVSRKPILKKGNNVNTFNKMEETGAKKSIVKNIDKSSEINIANQVFMPNELENQKSNLLDNVQEIPKQIDKIETKVISPNAEELADAQAKLADEITNVKKAEQLEIERIEAERIVSMENNNIEAEKEVKRKSEELAEAEKQAQLKKISIEIEKPIEEAVVVKPAPKSPTNYNEPGVSDELHKMKKIMDEIVYAVPPVIKVVKPIASSSIVVKTMVAPKPNPTKPTVKPSASIANPKTIPAKNPNSPISKSTSPIITITKVEKPKGAKVSLEKIVVDKMIERNKQVKKTEGKEIVNAKKNSKEAVPANVKKEVKKILEKKPSDKSKSAKKDIKKAVKKEEKK